MRIVWLILCLCVVDALTIEVRTHDVSIVYTQRTNEPLGITPQQCHKDGGIFYIGVCFQTYSLLPPQTGVTIVVYNGHCRLRYSGCGVEATGFDPASCYAIDGIFYHGTCLQLSI